jgi:glutamate 5-kinase
MTQTINLDNIERIVVKIGSSMVVDPNSNKLKEKWLASLCKDIASLLAKKKEVILVSSGAVSLGKKHIGLDTTNLKLEEKQAAAACGQPELIHNYHKYFAKHKRNVAQILLTLLDSENRRNYLNAKNTLETLLLCGVIPIVNENDTVATHELRFGDNDRLAARVAQMVGADLLIILSDIDGLYTANPKLDKSAQFIETIESISDDIKDMADNALSNDLGSGGMITKLAAAEITMQNGCDMVITSGYVQNPLKKLLQGRKHSYFKASESPLTARKKWIASSLNVKGSVVIDDGAYKAIKDGNSLLPAGIIDVEGEFERGDTITIKGCNGKEIAKGIAAYNVKDAQLIKGQQGHAIENIVGFSGRIEFIHRDDMVLSEESTT